jgi:hypothetical protein
VLEGRFDGIRMLIRLYPTSEAADERQSSAAAIGATEFFVRADAPGAVELIDGDAAPSGPADMPAAMLFTGGEFGDAGGDWLFMVGLWTPEDFREEFVAWYKIEHLPILLECPQWDGCRFVETPVSNGCQFSSLHQLNDRSALDSAERQRARSTPWFKRFSQNDWFDRAFTRTLYRRPE